MVVVVVRGRGKTGGWELGRIEDGRAKGDKRARYGSDPPAPHQKLVMAKGQESNSL